MSYRMATDHADLITAIAPFAGVGYKNGQRTHLNQSVFFIFTERMTAPSSGMEEVFSLGNILQLRRILRCGESSINVKKAAGYGQKIDLARRVEGKETIITSFANKDGSVLTELWRTENGGM